MLDSANAFERHTQKYALASFWLRFTNVSTVQWLNISINLASRRRNLHVEILISSSANLERPRDGVA